MFTRTKCSMKIGSEPPSLGRGAEDDPVTPGPSHGLAMTREYDSLEMVVGGLNDTEEDSIYFKTPDPNGCRRLVDFVLVWEDKPEEQNYMDHAAKRNTYLNELKAAGLQFEEDENTKNIALRFIKLHVPMDILKQYAEILKLRMTLKKSTQDDLKASAETDAMEGVDFLEFKLTEDQSSPSHDDAEEEEKAPDSFTIPLQMQKFNTQRGLQATMDKLQRPFYPSPDIYNRFQGHHYTAIYSRDKDYMFDNDDHKFFSPSARSRIVEFILRRKRFKPQNEDDFAFGITRLINDGVYLAAYPLHDGTVKTPGCQRRLLYEEWASFHKCLKYQPLDAIRDYYGVKMGLYFAWLGYYTAMLIPPSVVGILCLLYGFATSSYDTATSDICGGAMANTTMCPICDKFCGLWKLEDACTMTKAKYLFDNVTTVFFAVFMSLWAVIFLELWKRYSAEICHRWDVYGFDPEEEHPRPEYLLQLKNVKPEHWKQNYITDEKEPHPPFWRMKVPGVLISWTSVFMLVLLAGVTVLAIILYRMSMVVALAAVNDSTIQNNYSIFISMTGAAINLVLIIAFNYVYEYLAMWLTEKELHRTQTSYDDSLTVKIYLFQFINYYASIFYVAFFKGQFLGTPEKYRRLMGYRQEECSPGGCFMELAIQLGIIFCGKQFLLSILEYYMPLLWKVLNLVKLAGWKNGEEDGRKDGRIPQHIRDFKLVEWGRQGLFYEYLEMVIQYGFITIFVCAFPLAPLFALINNVLELRLDAKKILMQHRRPIAQKVRSIGVWFDIMETIGRISVITNALIIALTSEFIPKMVYKYFYSENGSLTGYVDFSLSTFALKDMDPQSQVNETEILTCRYPDYNFGPDDPNKYRPNAAFFHIWFARLLFVVIFENVIGVTMMALKLIIPDVPAKLKYRIRREAFVTTKLIMDREEKERRKKMEKVVTCRGRNRRQQAPLSSTSEVDLQFSREEQEEHSHSEEHDHSEEETGNSQETA